MKYGDAPSGWDGESGRRQVTWREGEYLTQASHRGSEKLLRDCRMEQPRGRVSLGQGVVSVPGMWKGSG